MGKNEDAQQLFTKVAGSLGLKDSPLERLVYFCLEALRLRSKSCFQELFLSFENSLKRDPEIEKLLRKIGSTQLGLADASSFSLFSMLEGMFK